MVVFKVMGENKQGDRHLLLEELIKSHRNGGRLLNDVPVRLKYQPQNRYDSRTLTFECYHWRVVGYVASELLDGVHQAVNCRTIVDVKISTIRFCLQYANSGPGSYAGISISRTGVWSRQAIASASIR